MGAAAMPAVSIAGSIIGAGLSAVGSMQQGQANAQAAKYQAQVAKNNKILADRKAQDAIDRGKVAEQRQRERTRQLKGRQRAILAANGVVVDQDSALDITSETEAIGEMDALTIRQNAEREALGYRTEGMNFQASSDLYGAQASNEQSAGYIGAAGSIFGGLTDVAAKWYSYDKQGAFGSSKNRFTYEGMT